MGTLYLVGTPIGNLEDVTLRALRVLRSVALIAAEDTRRTRTLLAHYQIAAPLVTYTDAYGPREQGRRARVVAALENGDVALVSDAGMPGLADPGYALVRDALAAGHPVVVVPGPSAPITALVGSGLPTERFVFLGFLPRRAVERRRRLAQYAAEPATLVAYETPQRLVAALADAAAVLGGERQAVVARELTKLHEEFWRGTLAQAHQHFSETAPRGEITVVIAGAPAAGPAWDEDRVRAVLAAARAAGLSAREAARQVAGESGWSRREVYALALAGGREGEAGAGEDSEHAEEDRDES
jgi:16S rRNA (cytidine1402-2'-O)-methyltransferase